MDNTCVRTGDALIFSSNTSTGIALRTFTSSLWNHSGIAIRINDQNQITLDDTGKLYVLEINTWERTDAVTGNKVIGAGYSDFDWVKERYNIIAVRRMRKEYRQKKIIESIFSFVELHSGYTFTTDIEPFLSVWLGVELMDDIGRDKSMFCSEFMSYFYMKILNIKEIKDIMGKNVILPRLCAPKHFSAEFTPDSPVFESENVVVYIQYCEPGPCLIPILIITFFIVAIVWMTLPRNR